PLLAPVDDQVVEDPAPLVAHQGVLGLTGADPGEVVREQALEEGEGALAADPETPHVADVEEPGDRPHGTVLVADAGVLLGHLPAPEIDQPAAQRPVA